MAQLETPIKLNVSDFPQEQQQMVERLADIYNFFVDNVANVVNGNISYDNLSNKKLITFQVTVDSTGKPNQLLKFSSSVGAIGSIIIAAKNITSVSVYPTALPFMSFTAAGNGIYTVNNISGLPANNKFELTAELCFL